MGAKGKHFQIVVQVRTAAFHLPSFILLLLITLIMKCEFYCAISSEVQRKEQGVLNHQNLGMFSERHHLLPR